MRVVVVGAGIGGLRLANGLRRTGADVEVLEAHDGITDAGQGYRININATGHDALHACLAAEQFADYECTLHRQNPATYLFSPALRLLSRTEMPPVPGAVDRGALRRVLAGGVTDRITFGHEVTSLADVGDADLVVAADGIGSALRRELLPHTGPEPLGWTAIFGRSPLSAANRPWMAPVVMRSRFCGVVDHATVLALCAYDPPVASATAPYVMWVLMGRDKDLPQHGTSRADLVLLAIGGTLLTGKAIGGRAESGQFRWRLAVIAALLPAAAIVGSYTAGLGDVPSMVIGAITSGVIVLADLLRSRSRNGSEHRIDVFAVVVLIEVAASVVLTSISGDARFVLARISFYLAIGGIVILATTWSQRPLMRTALKPVASQGDPARAAAFDRTWQHSRQFRALYRAMTAGLGAVLIADAALRVVIIYSQSADAVAESSLTAQLPLIILIAVWFATGRGLAVPRAMRLLEAELAKGSPSSPDSEMVVVRPAE
jgi:hypothetical protein